MISRFNIKVIRLILLILILCILLYILKISKNNKKIGISNMIFQHFSKNNSEKYIATVNNTEKPQYRLPVPKKVIRTWCSNDIKKSCGGRYSPVSAINQTKKILPDWEHIIYSDKDIDDFFDEYFGQDHIITKSYYLINPKYGAARADFFRYVVMYIHGGLYLDSKSCVLAKLPEIPDDKDMIVSHWYNGLPPHENILNTGYGEYQNWYIYTRPRASVLIDVINSIIHNIQLQHNNPTFMYGISQIIVWGETFGKNVVLYTTGPIAYTLAIKKSKHVDDVLVRPMGSYLSYTCNLTLLFKSNNKNHYSYQTEPLIKPNKNINKNINNMYLTKKNNYFPKINQVIYNKSNADKFFREYFDKNTYMFIRESPYIDIIWKYMMLYLNGGIGELSELKDTISIDSKTISNETLGVYILDNGLIMFLPFNPIFMENIIRILNNDISKKTINLNNIDWYKYFN